MRKDAKLYVLRLCEVWLSPREVWLSPHWFSGRPKTLIILLWKSPFFSFIQIGR